MRSLVVHVPHASTCIPDDVWQEFLVSAEQVKGEAFASADVYTDRMAREAWPAATVIEAPVSRIVVDVERFDQDIQEEMARVGRGVIYTHSHEHQRIRCDIGSARRADLIAQYYTPHWALLRKAAAGSTLIDLHTYPVVPWKIERHSEAMRPEIDIGFSAGLTPSEWVTDLTNHFGNLGYEVGHNAPYSGVIDAGAAAAVMIEIRRDMVGNPPSSPVWRRLIAGLKSMPIFG